MSVKVLNVLNRLCATMFILGWLNFMVFCHISQRIGGEALHGKIEGGRYYLATGYVTRGIGAALDVPHAFTEVSSGVFRYSQIHGYSAIVAFPLGLLAGFFGFYCETRLKHELTHAA